MPAWKIRIIGVVLAIVSCCTPDLVCAAAQQPASEPTAPAPATAAAPSEPPQTTAPDAPANNTEITLQSLPDAPSANAQEPTLQTRDGNTQKKNDTQQTEPAGTAAAQIGKLKGGPASKPAGAAIAPAKQRRVRSYLLKFGAIAGAGIAVGTVLALSHGSPSRPPGAQ